PATGKGCVVIFANARGHYTYITKHKATAQNWHNEEVNITQDAQGRAVITASFHEPSAKIILFGVS
ncbi:MAG: hypothetical protein ICV51_16610, partial [Flavisolibacter sp.]|nr:hypothetical protein [Flavisolibacter sp.]